MVSTNRKGIEWELAAPPPGEREEISFVLGQKSDLRTFLRVLFSILIPMYILFRSYFGSPDTHIEDAVFVGMVLCYVFLALSSKKKQAAWSAVWDWFLVFVSAAIAVYVVWSSGVFGYHTEYFYTEIFGQEIAVDVIAGTALLLLVLEANRRVLGWILVAIVGVFVLYIPLRPFLPGFLYGTPIAWTNYVMQMFSKGAGIYGTGTEVLISLVFLFLLFGALMIESRVGAFFTSLANGVVGNQKGGPAKVAVVASALIGTINSSGLASAATTGPITIPLMKSTGYKPHEAAAIEAVAATGGAFTPPVMGSIAYLMAQLLNIPYGNLCLYVAPTAFLYYLAVFAGVDAKARRGGLMGIAKEKLPSVTKVLLEGWHLVLPVILMVVLLTLGYSISRVGFVAITGTILMSFVRKETRMKAMRILSAFANATRATVMVSTTMILVGVIVAVVDVSGLGLTLSMLVEKASGGSLLIALFISAAVAFVLGMVLPPIMVYLYGVVFMIPALVDLGANPIAAHLFFFYWGTLALITPPVCVTAFTTAAIAGAPMMKTGFTAAKLAYPAYLLPFLFVFNPALILQGVTWAHIFPLFIAFAGIVVCTMGMEGYMFGNRNPIERIVIGCAGLCMILILLSPMLGYIGVGLLAISVAAAVVQKNKKRVEA